jgi:rhodanese-related sulfurtransferase
MKETLTPEQLRQELASQTPPRLLDVRRAEDKAQGPEGIPGAEWRDPAKVDEWAGGIPPGQETVLYCVRGGSVSKSVQAALAARGVSARYVEGGLAAFREAQALRG